MMLLAGLICAPSVARADAGMDVSNWQGCVDEQRARQAKAGGVSFAFVKATEGTGFVDRTADCTMQGLTAAGIRKGVYHFARPDANSPEAEAKWFIANTRGYIGTGVIPVLDWEPGGSMNGWSWWAKRWLDAVQAAWGVKPLIYMSASTISAGDWNSVAQADYGLWVAGYPRGYAADSVRHPGAPPYSLGPWRFAVAWQYSSSGTVPGVGDRIDVNWFYGDAATWSRYAGATVGSKANPAPDPVTPAPKQSSTPTGDAETLARAVIRGDYGNLPTRRRLLGSRYDEVQAVVDRILGSGSAAPQAMPRSVIVRPGDTISAIASRTGLYPLSAWQVPSGNINLIYVGQTVTFQGAANADRSAAAGTAGRHVVRPGESLWAIYGTGWRAAAVRNNLSAPYVIYPGQILN